MIAHKYLLQATLVIDDRVFQSIAMFIADTLNYLK
jgi:hypothetical protein